MAPAAALRRIAYLLEEELADAFRCRAFRRAARELDAVPAEELTSLAASGRLRSLPGVGETSARIIAETLDRGRPAYLEELEARRPAPLEGRAAEIRSRLRGDCHTHSDWSDGSCPIAEMAGAAIELGHEYLVLTDHSPRLRVARGLSPERLRLQLEEVARLNAELRPFRILTGIEVDILDDGGLDQEPELLGQLDLVVASVHSKLRMEEAQMTERLVAAVSNPRTDVLGHCTGRLIRGRERPPSTFDAERVFRACAEAGTAVEINSRPERQDPPLPLLELALGLGCRFTIDTDAHAPGELEWLRLGAQRAARAGLGAELVLNSLPAAELLQRGRSPGRAGPAPS